MTITDPEPIEPDPKQLLLQALETRWEAYQAKLQNCREGFTEEAVHDLRVATRRILALIRLLNSISPQPHLKKMARAFKGQLDEFDELRDTQVILDGLPRILPELPQLEQFEERLRVREQEMLWRLHNELEQWDNSKLAAWVGKTHASVASDTSVDLRFLILDAVDDAFLVTRQRLGWVDLSRSATIHRVRVAFKAFRYMVEIVHPILRGFPSGALKQMNEYQTLMGNIQDAEVFAQTVADFAMDASFPDGEVILRYCEKRHSETLSVFVQSMDRLHAFWRPSPEQHFPWEGA